MDTIDIDIKDQMKINLSHLTQIIEDIDFKLSELVISLSLLKQENDDYINKLKEVILNYEYLKLMVDAKIIAFDLFKNEINNNLDKYDSSEIHELLEDSESSLANLQKLSESFISEFLSHREDKLSFRLKSVKTNEEKAAIVKKSIKEGITVLSEIMYEFNDDVKDIDKIENDNNLLLHKYIIIKKIALQNICIKVTLENIKNEVTNVGENSDNKEVQDLSIRIVESIDNKIDLCSRLYILFRSIKKYIKPKIANIEPSFINAFVQNNTDINIKHFESKEFNIINTYFFNNKLNVANGVGEKTSKPIEEPTLSPEEIEELNKKQVDEFFNNMNKFTPVEEGSNAIAEGIFTEETVESISDDTTAESSENVDNVAIMSDEVSTDDTSNISEQTISNVSTESEIEEISANNVEESTVSINESQDLNPEEIAEFFATVDNLLATEETVEPLADNITYENVDDVAIVSDEVSTDDTTIDTTEDTYTEEETLSPKGKEDFEAQQVAKYLASVNNFFANGEPKKPTSNDTNSENSDSAEEIVEEVTKTSTENKVDLTVNTDVFAALYNNTNQ